MLIRMISDIIINQFFIKMDVSAEQSPHKLPLTLLEVEEPDFVDISTNSYRSFCAFIIMAFILGISSIQFGYALCEISTVSIGTLITTFNITLSPGLANGILVGIMPIGGIFGTLLNGALLRCFSKKRIHYVVTILNLVSTVLEQITTMETILIGRFILGVCCGIYTAVAAQYIKEISPFKLRPLFGSLFSMGRILGIVLSYGLGTILNVEKVEAYWRIMFAVPGGLALLQALLIFFYVPDSPVQMLQKGHDERLQAYVVKYYHEDHHHNVMTQYKVEHELQQNNLKEDDVDHSYHIDPLVSNKRRALIMAIYLSAYREFVGGNTITIFAGQMIGSIDQPFAPFASITVNGIQFVTTAISTFWLGRLLKRRTCFLSSGIIMGVSCYVIFFGYIFTVDMLILVFLAIYIAIYGLLYAPVNWAYPAQILPPSKVVLAITVSWIGLAITTIFPPIIMQKMDNNAFPIYLFFAVYITISLIYIGLKLVESRGRSYKQIIEEY